MKTKPVTFSFRIITIFVLLFSIIYTGTFGQEKKVSQKNQLKAIMEKQIVLLKEGALLVCLHTKISSIIALRDKGNNSLADEIQKKQRDENLCIVSAFKNHFDFCPVYFFFSNDLTNIIKKKFESVYFLNDSLIEDSTIRFSGKSFLISEFGYVKPDTAKILDNTYYTNTGNGSELEKSYYGSPDLRFEALVISSNQFIQLRRPFPYYVKIFREPTNEFYKKAVLKMNNRLTQYYKEIISK